MEFLIIAMVLAKFFERGAIDVVSMVTKQPPPSRTYQEAKGGAKGDGPLKRFFSSWWEDAIGDADEFRRTRRMDSKEKAAEKAKRKKEREETVNDAKPEIPVEPAPRPEDYTPDEPTPKPAPDLPPVDRPEAPDAKPWDPPWPGPEPKHRPETVDLPPVLEDEELTEKINKERTGPAVDDTPTPADTEALIDGPAGPLMEDFTTPKIETEPVDDTEWTPLIPKEPHLKVVVDNTRGTDMTQTTGSTQGQTATEGGIGTHIRWTAATADWQSKAIVAVENVKSQMAGADNGPEVLALAALIEDAHNVLKAHYQHLNALLVAHKTTVGDAYAATGNQAGSKDYVTSE